MCNSSGTSYTRAVNVQRLLSGLALRVADTMQVVAKRSLSKAPVEVAAAARAPVPTRFDPHLRGRAANQLRGAGIEIGALHNPFPAPPTVQVKYVDKFPYEKLCAHNSDVDPKTIMKPEIVCDTASLDGVADASVDFVITCHVLEHLHNPLRAMLAWHRVLKPGGVAVCIVPDAAFTFDRGRELTTLEHLLWDLRNDGTEMKRLFDLLHIAECNLNMHAHLNADTAVDLARVIMRDSYDTHFHTWTFESFGEQLDALIDQGVLPFRVLDRATDRKNEMLFVLEAD